MNALEAHEHLARLTLDERDDLLPGDFIMDLPLGKADCWPAAATALVSITGSLPSCDTEPMLYEALRYAHTVLELGHIDEVEWKQEAFRIVQAICEEAYRKGWEYGFELGMTEECSQDYLPPVSLN